MGQTVVDDNLNPMTCDLSLIYKDMVIKYLTQPNNSSGYLQNNSGMGSKTHKYVIKQHKTSCPTVIITYLYIKSQTDCKIQNKNAMILFGLKHVF